MDLYWNEQGSVCCAAHAPYPGTDTWVWERWQRISPSERLEVARMRGTEGPALECEVGRNCGGRK